MDINKKKTLDISYKSLAIKEVDVSKSSRTVEGYFAAFGSIDSDRDLFTKGAFAKSIIEHGPESLSNRQIAHLAYHDTQRPIGKITELTEDDYGLKFKSVLGNHQEGSDFLEMYRSGIINEHSVGFQYIQDKIIGKQDSDGMRYDQLTEVKLWEGSAVVFGANENTLNLSEIKSQKQLNDVLDGVNQRMEKFVKAIQDQNLSTKYNDLFAIELQQLKDSYISLIQRESFEDTQIETKSDEKDEEIIDQVDDNRMRYIF